MLDYDSYVDDLILKDEEAFRIIYDDTKNAVFGIIISVVKDRNLAEDVMQDTYIKMIKSIRIYKRNGKFINWLLTIAKNQAIDYYRKRNKEVLLDYNDETNEPLLKDDNNFTFSLETNRLLDLLSDIEREIVILKIVNDFKFREIAEFVGKPLGTVLWIYNKSIKKMQEAEGSNND
ncbi:MAG: RNA polymerase sigma factor [Bacilli bacterium]|jgi:RNA polymerase sigma-70 factor (ECF subfamily)|nr:RNA polymerase sigma factor [Bacilli bacterium]MDD2681754.1 RNA polymerase sigma factor [Bacilli bacterium]MDD3121341.1 RNA polymerase sigma factor [Bacilli bacterium]MDD4063825.1 RNA polymerase sigma factor [Bacilli bacterium]MDD4482069.1 RNA polymerase sigma factor [Bacilli bacterium]